MSSEDAAIARQVDVLRRDGSVVARFGSGEEAAEWRAAMRRTGLANADERIARAQHVDHQLTKASERASRRAIEAAYNGEPRVPFHELVREEQRKMFHVVRDDGEQASS
jgi:hypothetical protein